MRWGGISTFITAPLWLFSFVALLSDEDRDVWVEELRTTLRHELTHHVEGLAGERGLERFDEAELAWFR